MPPDIRHLALALTALIPTSDRPRYGQHHLEAAGATRTSSARVTRRQLEAGTVADLQFLADDTCDEVIADALAAISSSRPAERPVLAGHGFRDDDRPP